MPIPRQAKIAGSVLRALLIGKTGAIGVPHLTGHFLSHHRATEPVRGSVSERYLAPIPGLNPLTAGAIGAAGGAAGEVAAHRLLGRTAFGTRRIGRLSRPEIAGTALLAGGGMAAFQAWAQRRRNRRIAHGKTVASGGGWRPQAAGPRGRIRS